MFPRRYQTPPAFGTTSSPKTQKNGPPDKENRFFDLVCKTVSKPGCVCSDAWKRQNTHMHEKVMKQSNK